MYDNHKSGQGIPYKKDALDTAQTLVY